LVLLGVTEFPQFGFAYATYFWKLIGIFGVSTMSYLDDPRVLFAAERTLLAWQRTAIALMGFGFVVERFGLFLRIVTNQPLNIAQRGASLWLGVALLLLGALMGVASAIQFRQVVRGLGEKEIPRGYWVNMGVVLNFILASIALVLAIYFVVSSS
jgi:putative membrane protein